MVFSKTFPRNIDGSPYPRWEEITLTDKEEKEIEEACRQQHHALFLQCVSDAKKMFDELRLKDYQSDLMVLSTALFEKQASHVIFLKESKTKEKFDALWKTSPTK